MACLTDYATTNGENIYVDTVDKPRVNIPFPISQTESVFWPTEILNRSAIVSSLGHQPLEGVACPTCFAHWLDCEHDQVTIIPYEEKIYAATFQ
jgi:hypothetical protein